MCAHIHKRVYLSEFLCRSDRVTFACRYARLRVCLYRQGMYMSSSLHPIAFGVSCNLILQSQSNWSLFNGTWQKRRRELDNRLSFEIGEGIPPIPPMRCDVLFLCRQGMYTAYRCISLDKVCVRRLIIYIYLHAYFVLHIHILNCIFAILVLV